MKPSDSFEPLSRRALLGRLGTGLGIVGLAGLLSEQRLLADAAGREQSAGAEDAAFRAAGQEHHSSIHEWRPFPGRYLRSQAGPGSLPWPAHADGGLRTERSTRGLMKSPFRFRQHGQSGLPISEIFPRMAAHADDLCVIRSMHTNVPNHEPSLLMMTCGDTQPVRPSYGLLAALWPGHGKPEPARFCGHVPRFSGGRPRSFGATAFCPASFKARTSITPISIRAASCKT